MSDALDPRIVAERLAELRRSFVAETVDEARERLTREQPRPRLPSRSERTGRWRTSELCAS